MVMLPKIPKTKEHLERLQANASCCDCVKEERIKELWFGVFVAILIAAGAMVVAIESVIEQDKRLKRLERIERIDSIGRRY